MPNPATFEALNVEGYTPEWDERSAPDGNHFEHARFDLPNGYSVSVARTDLQPVSLGYENGNWEAAIMRPIHNPIVQILTGNAYQPATELEDLTTDEVQGHKLVGNLDNASLKVLLDNVASRPTAPTDQDADFQALFAGAEGTGEEDGL